MGAGTISGQSSLETNSKQSQHGRDKQMSPAQFSISNLFSIEIELNLKFYSTGLTSRCLLPSFQFLNLFNQNWIEIEIEFL